MKLNLPAPVQLSIFVPKNYNVLVYGKHGTGKTEFAATWPKPILFFDCDDGIVTILASKRISPADKAQIHIIPIQDRSPDKHVRYPMGYLTVKGGLTLIADTGMYDNVKPKTVVIDSTTTLSDFTLSHVLHENNHTGQQPTLPDWGKQIRYLMDVINLGVGLGTNFICVAHEQYQKDELSGRVWCLPLVTGKYANRVGGSFDELYHTKVTETAGVHKYELETKASGLISAKSRLDLPSPILTHYDSIKGTIEKLGESTATLN